MLRLRDPRGALAALFLCAALSACGEETGVTTPQPGTPTLLFGTWHLHEIGGDALPAVAAERYVGVVFEETWVDSAQMSVDPFQRTWSQRYWTRITHNGVLDRSEAVLDEGTYESASATLTFTSIARQRVFSVSVTSGTQLATDEALATFVGAPSVLTIYRSSRP